MYTITATIIFTLAKLQISWEVVVWSVVLAYYTSLGSITAMGQITYGFYLVTVPLQSNARPASGILQNNTVYLTIQNWH